MSEYLPSSNQRNYSPERRLMTTKAIKRRLYLVRKGAEVPERHYIRDINYLLELVDQLSGIKSEMRKKTKTEK